MLETNSFPRKKILILTPARLGDTLFCTPSIALIKKTLPSVTIDALALSALSAEVLSNNPVINNIYLLPNHTTTKKLAQNYDLAIGLHPNADIQRYLTWLKLENKLVPTPHFDQHQSVQTIDYIKKIFKIDSPDTVTNYYLYPQTEHLQKIQQILYQNKISLDKEILIGLHLGCHSTTKATWKWWQLPTHRKIWPIENFIKLAEKLLAEFPNIRFIITGTHAEKKLAAKFIRAIPNTINLINQTSVLELAALMKSLKIYLTCDTGALHVACAMNTSLIALFGPTALQQTGPYPLQTHYRILQAPTMRDITVEKVYAAFTNLLGTSYENRQ